MSPAGTSSISFPAFRGVTRWLVVVNVISYFAMLLLFVVSPAAVEGVIERLGFVPGLFVHGWLWQAFTYSFIHPAGSILGTAFELVSLWFLAGFLEQMHRQSWVLGLYGASVAGTAIAAMAIYFGSHIGYELPGIALVGCFGGIFGMLVAIGILYGDMEFLLLMTIPIKARYMAVIYGLIAVAMLFGALRMYAFAQLGGALAGWIFIQLAPRRGLAYAASESWFGLRNRYYRWKRHKAARKFEVYMKSQGKTVRFNGQGQPLDEDADDKKRWN